MTPGMVKGPDHAVIRAKIKDAYAEYVRQLKVKSAPTCFLAVPAAENIQKLEPHLATLEAERADLDRFVSENVLHDDFPALQQRADALPVLILQAKYRLLENKIIYHRAMREMSFVPALESKLAAIHDELQTRGQSRDVRSVMHLAGRQPTKEKAHV